METRSWGAIIWRICAWMSIFLALATALQGKAECFAWAVAAFLEWGLSNKPNKESNGESNEL